MTIIIAMKTSYGIAIACDSRTTDPSGLVRDDAQKLHIIKFQDGNTAILARAGNEDFSSRVVETISVLAGSRIVHDYRSVASCAEEAVAKLREQIGSQYKGTAEEMQKHFEQFSFELMISHYHKGSPYVFTLDSTTGLAVKRDKPHFSIGCGCMLADFLLTRLDFANFGLGDAIWTLVYAVEEVKKFDARCGGTTRSAIVGNNREGLSDAAISEEAPMLEAVNEAISFSEQTKSEWRTTVQNRIRTLVARRMFKQKTEQNLGNSK